MPSNLAAIVLNRELSSKRNYRPSIELLLESSYFTNSDRKHLAEDFPLNDTGQPHFCERTMNSIPVFYLLLHEVRIAPMLFLSLQYLISSSFTMENHRVDHPLHIIFHFSNYFNHPIDSFSRINSGIANCSISFISSQHDHILS